MLESVGQVVDVTERRRAEEAFRESERLAVVRLASTIAHEINKPLESVTNLPYLAANTEKLEDVRQYNKTAESELTRVSHDHELDPSLPTH